jgi:hypothetical protein
MNNPTTKSFEDWRRELDGAYPPGRLVHSYGGDHPNILIVGYKAVRGEQHPFQTSPGIRVVEGLVRLGVPPAAVRIGYLFRDHEAPNDDKACTKLWVKELMEEIDILKPRAVLLLGKRVADTILGVNDNDIDKYRRTRFATKPLGVNFMVTYSPEELAAAGDWDTETSKTFMEDLFALVTVNEKHYPNLILLAPAKEGMK